MQGIFESIAWNTEIVLACFPRGSALEGIASYCEHWIVTAHQGASSPTQPTDKTVSSDTPEIKFPRYSQSCHVDTIHPLKDKDGSQYPQRVMGDPTCAHPPAAGAF